MLQNENGYWAAVLVEEVLARQTGAPGLPSLTFSYRILPGKLSDFGSPRDGLMTE